MDTMSDDFGGGTLRSPEARAGARLTALIGLGATLWFALSLFGFAALQPGYSHFTKAVSELGVDGAANALAWNIVGFGGTGLLLAWFGWRYGRLVLPGTSWAAIWLAVSGLAFAANGVFPANMSNWWAPVTIAHISMSLLVQLAWFVGVYPVYGLRRTRWNGLVTLTTWTIWALVAVFMLRFVPGLLPGLTQRLAFAVYFAWYAAACLQLLAMVRTAETAGEAGSTR
jgi:hypothetical membrane protein